MIAYTFSTLQEAKKHIWLAYIKELTDTCIVGWKDGYDFRYQ